MQSLKAQSPSILDDVKAVEVREDLISETWFGWIDTPNQQIRTFLRLRRNAEGGVQSASLSTDLVPVPKTLSELQFTNNGEWKFKIASAALEATGLSFVGIQATPETVLGTLEQSNQKLQLDLKKLPTEPAESRMQLGANLVWYGKSEDETNSQEYRIRVYNSFPFVNAGKPRIVFDAITKGMLGVPTKFTEAGDVATFEIATPSTRSRYLARLTPDGNELIGTLNEGKDLVPLTLKRWSESPSDANSTISTTSELNADKTKSTQDKDIVQATELPSKESQPTRKNNRAIRLDAESKTLPKSLFALASSEFYIEREFEVKHGSSTVRTKSFPNGKPGIALRGIMTLPRSSSINSPAPAVVILSGTGPHDQDGSIGRHKPSAAIAHYLAENGIASLRYEDRGISDGADFYAHSSEDYCKDAIAVWRYAKSQQSIDPRRVGMLGHSEGAMISIMAATWEPSIAYLILLSPAGLSGSDISRLQIDKFSELQGMTEEDRTTTNLLQAELQSLATNYVASEDAFPQLIREAVNRNWEGLKAIAIAQDPKANLGQVKQQLIEQIENKFDQLRQPWFRYYLAHDPITNWMLIQCPTLAIWGENDTQVLADINRARIANTIRRNASLDATLEIMPDLNHLLQKGKTGLPDEYEQIKEPIAPEALSRILQWSESLGIVDRSSKK